MLKRGSVELAVLINIRDEAHRFAITFHKSLRNKHTFNSPLDEIQGIGKIKKTALLAQFKTSEGVKQASIDELRLVKGINPALAEKIYNYFHFCPNISIIQYNPKFCNSFLKFWFSNERTRIFNE